MAQPNLELQIARSPVLRYGLAVLSVSVALGASLLVERERGKGHGGKLQTRSERVRGKAG